MLNMRRSIVTYRFYPPHVLKVCYAELELMAVQMREPDQLAGQLVFAIAGAPFMQASQMHLRTSVLTSSSSLYEGKNRGSSDVGASQIFWRLAEWDRN